VDCPEGGVVTIAKIFIALLLLFLVVNWLLNQIPEYDPIQADSTDDDEDQR
jgi:hypothetical protein